MTKKNKIIEEFEENLHIKSVEYSNLGGFRYYKDEVQQDKKKILELLDQALSQQREKIKEAIEQEINKIMKNPREEDDSIIVVLTKFLKVINKL